MVFAKKYFKEIIFFLVIICLFIFTRLYNITTLPIFTDEAIYVRWAQIAKSDASWRFISLTDGKQPLFIWLVMGVMKFVDDPLLAGRLVSTGAGFGTVIGLFFLSKELFKNRWIGTISSFFYVIFPMGLVYDRMALYDSLVVTFAVWGLYIAILMARRVSLDVSLILGLVIGGGVLNKTSGFFTLYLLPSTLLLFNWKNKTKIVKFFFLSLIVLIFTYGIYSILRLSPFFHIIEDKNAIFVYPFSEWIKHPFDYFFDHLKGLFDWLITYLSWSVFILIISSFLISKDYFREKLLLLIWFLAPFTALALFGNNIYPRFILFMIVYLLPLAAFTAFKAVSLIRNKYLYIFLSFLVIFLSVYSDYFIVFNFAKAPIPYSDRSQYNNDWPSGAGVKESVAVLKDLSRDKKIFVGTEGTFGLMPYAYEIYLKDNPNIVLKGFWPISDVPPKEIMEISKKMPAYFVFYQSCTLCQGKGIAPISWNVKLVFQYEKAAGNSFLSLYKIQ